jgi:hypothetical protein
VHTISSNAKTDWFVDPFDGTVAKTAPILLFTPGADYVLSARVTVQFATKWDVGALMLWGDDHHWAKLSFEFSPDQSPPSSRWSRAGFLTIAIPYHSRAIRFICVSQRAATPTCFTSQRTDKIGKSFARLAWIRNFLCAWASSRSHPLVRAPLPSFPSSHTILIASATSTNSSAHGEDEFVQHAAVRA